MRHQEIIEECYREWDRLWHNASLVRYLPEMKNEYEEYLFWLCLCTRRSRACKNLSGMIEERYGWKLTFWSYGRNGATIAPGEWMGPAACNDFGGFASWKVLEGVGSGLEGYNYDREVLAILRWINRYWRGTAEHIGEWWDDMMAGNEHFQELIDEHEEMTLKSVEMWVPA